MLVLGSCPIALAGRGLGAMAHGPYAKGNVFPGWCPGAGFRGGSWAVLVATSTPCFRGGSRERGCNAGSGPGVWGRAQGWEQGLCPDSGGSLFNSSHTYPPVFLFSALLLQTPPPPPFPVVSLLPVGDLVHLCVILSSGDAGFALLSLGKRHQSQPPNLFG